MLPNENTPVHSFTVDDQLVALWRSEPARASITVQVRPLRRLSARERRHVADRFDRYATFIGRPTEHQAVVVGPRRGDLTPAVSVATRRVPARRRDRAIADHVRVRAAIRVVAGLFAVLWALPGFGLIDLEVTIAPDAEWRQVALLDGGWGLFVTAFIVAGLVLVTMRPVWASEIAAQLGGVAALIAVSAVIAGEFTVWWMLLALALPAGTLAGLAALGRRRGVPVMAERPTPVTYWAGWSYFGLTVLAGTFWLDYAVDMYRANRDGRPPAEITNDVNHWAIQAAFALALVGFSVLATARAALRRFNAVRVGLCAAYFGLCSLRFPDAAAALSTTGAALAIAWGVALVAVAAADRWPAARLRQG